MARPKSEDKRIALLQAATVAIAQAGISASTASIARSAGVAEGTLFRYFATKDDLLNALYIWLKHDLGSIILQQVDFEAASPKQQLNSVWDNYIDWGITHPLANACMRHLAVSGKITQETEQQVANMFPELDRLCESRIRPIFREPPLRAFLRMWHAADNKMDWHCFINQPVLAKRL
ncbi:TetR/AcrR family transcriptional regulator [Erwinia sp. HR93]|uniref:TetR/AcrR family transcriptional regulator n=1 Tax=Erwinia sp. HR93 TaxID=3094840 RepID=UPI002ADEFBA2|nr:TetR/AcrR family transcriptional regulator [Erwinia sp. HR93]MEA1065014.1 TetR/AcrR family transcriptional regulator [Erwinia sp. HR93]